MALLTSDNYRSLPRHRTLQAAVDWSYHLLSAPEQVLLRRLALFRGGWSLEAAEAITGDPDDAVGEHWAPTLATAQVLSLLRQLTNKSMITMESAADGSIRYQLLEPLRQVLYTRLIEAGEESVIQQRHLAYYAQLAKTAEVGLSGIDQQRWLDRLETEHDNLRLALKWGSEHRNTAATMSHMAAHLLRFWLVRGHYVEGRHWLEQALASSHLPDAVRVRLFYGAGVLARLQLDLTAAQRFASAQMQLAQQLGDQQGIADSYGVQGWIEEFLGDYPTALTHFTTRLTLTRALGNRRGMAYALRGMGETATALGRYEEADAWLHEALTIFLQLGDERYAAQLWNDLGKLAYALNQLEVADSCFQISLTAYRRVHDRHGIATLLLNLGALALTQQDLAGATVLQQEAEQLLHRLADKLLSAQLWSMQARLAYHSAKWAAADAAARTALHLRCAVNQRPGVITELDLFAAVTLARRQATRAVCLWGAVDHFRQLMHMPISPRDQPFHAHQLELARAELAPADFEAAWQMGQKMSWEQLIVYALDGNI